MLESNDIRTEGGASVKNWKRVWLVTVIAETAVIAVLAALLLARPAEDTPQRDLQMRMSPATRVEYRQAGETFSMVDWTANPFLGSAFCREQLAMQALQAADGAIDTSQWVFRITYHLDEVSANVPEIVCLVGDGWESVDGDVYVFPTEADGRAWLHTLSGVCSGLARTNLVENWPAAGLPE